jgi:ribonuclease Y
MLHKKDLIPGGMFGALLFLASLAGTAAAQDVLGQSEATSAKLLWVFIAAVAGIVVGGVLVYLAVSVSATSTLKRAKLEAERILATQRAEAEAKSKDILLTAQQQRMTMKEAAEKELDKEREEIRQQEQRLNKREDTLDRKLDTLSMKERNLDDLDARLSKRDKSTAAREQELNRVYTEQKDKLLAMSNMTHDQAKHAVLARVEDDCRAEVGEIVLRTVEHAQEEAKEKSRQIILQAIQRYAAEQTAAHTVSTVAIPTDDMKGRVIGREGRNIRTFEKATGVDVIIDDTPGLVVVSCFDPVRREIARISLEKLVQDGRIHPARIEEVVVQTTKEMDEELIRIGKEAAVEANLPNLAKPIIPMLGRLHYRTSYGQNVLRHSMEVAYLSQTVAEELGLDGNLARRAGLLHDIGKAMDHEQEGSHPVLGKEFLKKFGEHEAVLNAAEGHHGDVPATTPYTGIVMAADAISAARPGARRESLEKYIKRLQELEDLAMKFDGVRQAYAISAGREVRVIVDARMVDDKEGAKLARDIAKRIEDELTYPGEIRVTLIRETRSVEYAR